MNRFQKIVNIVLLTICFPTVSLALDSHPAIFNSAPVWDTLDREVKIRAVEETIKIFRDQGIIIRKEPEFYVDEIDQIRAENLDMRIEKVGVILKTVAIMYRDYDNGEDADKLIFEVLSEEAYDSYIKNNEKEIYEELYQDWKSAKFRMLEPAGSTPDSEETP